MNIPTHQGYDDVKLRQRIEHHLSYTLGDFDKESSHINKRAWWQALCMAVNDTIFLKLKETQQRHRNQDVRRVYYLSLEYLVGRLTTNNLNNLDLYDVMKDAVASFGMDIADLLEEAPDMALGNGGLGRLAACYIDSLATMDFPAIAYGIHYENGLFKQEIDQGRQIERPDVWREFGNPWEICRPEFLQEIGLYGAVTDITNDQGESVRSWQPASTVTGVPWDIPVVGYQSNTVNILRLWQCRVEDHFDWDQFNAGLYHDAHRNRVLAETVSRVLYPSDETPQGQELRFVQQYFFCACSIKDIVARYQKIHGDDWSQLVDKCAIQLNDTHPTIAILELMRLLTDENGMSWSQAWSCCQEIFSYTNHTLLPEALESWSVSLFERVLPRHLEILYRINEEFLNNYVDKHWPNNIDMRRKLSIVQENGHRTIRMANLCVITSHKVNGVAAIHSALVKKDLFPEFNEIWPDKLINVTNGITPRRWLLSCNPELAEFLNERVDNNWPTNLYLLEKLAEYADDKDVQNTFMAIKLRNKQKLADHIKQLVDVEVDPKAIFDVQIKRLHEYKRQHLNLLHILSMYRHLLNNPDDPMAPRVFIFSAKAAPSYHLAKEIIYAINKVADRINNDARIKGKLKVVFLPNYRVSLAEKIIPAADVSEQISTAGKEASGTGNMKLALNGAVTIGTMDGANIEIAEAVGDDNIFIFGLDIDEMKALDDHGYDPMDYYNKDADIKACLDWLTSDYFTPEKPGELSAIRNNLLESDPYRVLVDFDSYKKAHRQLDVAYRDSSGWAKKAIINTAMMGKFNSDRSIQDYVDRIWNLEPS